MVISFLRLLKSKNHVVIEVILRTAGIFTFQNGSQLLHFASARVKPPMLALTRWVPH